ncbi:MAG: type I glyceraldehyde-3-phosphate dehydrogenase [Candidatus Marinimicrobia bacterium]|nr:type I glyceraldehyde-3-phosphate dehydrogenase [Candidatus Neomarinimicrobiota bacterium]|tara:strand:+ start:23606 stop:24622 length:1017 start_codon:yes stop_codon:yes gene_type:complete
MSNKIKIGLMGFGRVGRNLFRLGYNNPNLEFVVISDLGRAETLRYLLVRDSVHGPLGVEADIQNNYLNVENQSVRLLPGGKPSEIPWDLIDVDVMIDTTGVSWPEEEFEAYRKFSKQTIITNPDISFVDRIIVPGVNGSDISLDDKIISPSSSTTQVLALMLKILDSEFSVKNAMMATVHAYTSDQPLADNTQANRRRSRSAVENIIPNETPSTRLVEALYPHLKGKVSGTAFNVPVADGSCVDLTTEHESLPSAEEVNEVMKTWAEGSLSGIVAYTEDPIVSRDVIGRGESLVFDAKATMIAADHFLKTICWYDNGWGYSKRILEIVESYSELGGKN